MCWIVFWSRSVLHQIVYTRGVTGALTQTRHGMVQGGIAIVRDILWCTGTSCGIQWHVEECGGTWCYAVAYGTTRQALGAFPPMRLVDRDIRYTVRCSSPEIDKDAVELLRTPCSAEISLRLVYQQI